MLLCAAKPMDTNRVHSRAPHKQTVVQYLVDHLKLHKELESLDLAKRAFVLFRKFVTCMKMTPPPPLTKIIYSEPASRNRAQKVLLCLKASM